MCIKFCYEAKQLFVHSVNSKLSVRNYLVRSDKANPLSSFISNSFTICLQD